MAKGLIDPPYGGVGCVSGMVFACPMHIGTLHAICTYHAKSAHTLHVVRGLTVHTIVWLVTSVSVTSFLVCAWCGVYSLSMCTTQAKGKSLRSPIYATEISISIYIHFLIYPFAP